MTDKLPERLCFTRNSLMNGISQLISNDLDSYTKIARALIIMRNAANDIFDQGSELQQNEMMGVRKDDE